MLRTIGKELKNHPFGSFGAFCGITTLLLDISNFPNSPESSFEGSYNSRLLIGLLSSTAVAYSFLFMAYIMLRSKTLALELSSFFFIFVAALSSKIIFSEIFLKPAKLELDATAYTNLQDIVAILVFFLGVTISTVLYSANINRHFYKTDKTYDDDRFLAYLVLVIVICITWISALYFPLK